MYFVIVNGKSASSEELRTAITAARQSGRDVAVRVTWEAGDASRFVTEGLSLGADVIVAAGGDGTVNEVASALASQDADADALPSLGIIPLGTANDFANGAHLPLSVTPALDYVLHSTAVPIDLLQVQADGDVRWCVNLASGGFGTQVTVDTDPQLKERLGGLAYLLTGITKIGQLTAGSGSARGEEFAWSGDVIAFGLGNGRQAGGGQQLCPRAKVNDGLIDLTILPGRSADNKLIGLLRTALSDGGEAALKELAVTARSPWFELRSEAPFTLNLDGEPMEASAFRLDAIPGRLRVHLPALSPLL